MKTHFNQNGEGRFFADLCQLYDTEDFYEECIVSEVENGNYGSALYYFNMLKGHHQVCLMRWLFDSYGYRYKQTLNIILEGVIKDFPN